MKINLSIFNLLVVVSTLILGIGYAAINSIILVVNGVATASPGAEEKLYIFEVTPVNNNSTSVVNNTAGTFLDSTITLSADNPSNSYASFQITLHNNTNYNYQYVNTNFILGEDTYDNENIIFEITNMDTDTIIASKSTYTFTITYRYADSLSVTNNILNNKLKFVFKNTSAMVFNELILLNEQDNNSLNEFNNKYYYSGNNVNNYVWFNCNDGFVEGEENCERWRVVSINEDNSVKIVKDEPLEFDKIADLETETKFWLNNTSDYIKNKLVSSGKIIFDHKARRPLNSNLENSYCSTSYNGCNAFAKDDNIFTGSYDNLNVDGDSLMRLYLETIYYPYVLTPSAKEQIKTHLASIGIVENTVSGLETKIDEDSITSYSNVSLLNMTDYLYSSTSTECHNKNSDSSCQNNNWLASSGVQFHLLNAKKGVNLAQIWTVNTSGKLESRDANNEFNLKPVVVLRETKQAIGTGLYDNPYKIVE